MRLEPYAKPVRIRIKSGGEEHSTLESLKKNFRFEDIFPLMKPESSFFSWIKQQSGTTGLLERMEKYKPSTDDVEKVTEKDVVNLFSVFFVNVYQKDDLKSIVTKLKDGNYDKTAEYLEESYDKTAEYLEESIERKGNSGRNAGGNPKAFSNVDADELRRFFNICNRSMESCDIVDLRGGSFKDRNLLCRLRYLRAFYKARCDRRFDEAKEILDDIQSYARAKWLAKAIDSSGVMKWGATWAKSSEGVANFLKLINGRRYPVEVEQVKNEVVKLYKVESIKTYDAM